MEHVALAAQAVAHDSAQIVILAIEPNGPEVEYGYIMPRAAEGQITLWGTHQTASFIEKPNRQLAQELVNAGGLWNTMIMVFQSPHCHSRMMRRFVRQPTINSLDIFRRHRHAREAAADRSTLR